MVYDKLSTPFINQDLGEEKLEEETPEEREVPEEGEEEWEEVE